ncbi:MAG: PH domain-containing protein [Candidatus Sumerlaeia bacterium]
MYEMIKDLTLSVLRCPKEPPEPPVGSYDSVYVFRASKKFLRYRLLGLWISMGGFVIFGLVGFIIMLMSLQLLGVILAILITIFVAIKFFILYVMVRLDYEMRYYIITDRSLRIRENVWQIRETTITFENIQNVRVTQGPLQRIFGIYDVVVETAGGGGMQDPSQGMQGNMHRGTFRGIERPQELRDLIMNYLKNVRTSGLGHSDEDEEDEDDSTTGFSPESIQVLQAIAKETQALRQKMSAG